MKVNIAQRCDALDLLRSLPDRCTPLVFFDPEYRGVLDHLKFGNEGARQRGRATLPAMSEQFIDASSREIARVLTPSGYLMRWADQYSVCEGHHLRVVDAVRPVGMITWDNQRLGTLAAESAALVRAEIASRSCSATAARMWIVNLVAVGLSQQTRARPAFVHAHEVVPYGKSPSERARVKTARAAQKDDAGYLANLLSPRVHIDSDVYTGRRNVHIRPSGN